jgi:4-amino-4-deoxy-L-arabinose transferase-like glycosyltransferase
MSARPKLALGLILGVALVARVAVILASPDYTPAFDSADYVRHAVSIGSGDGFPDSIFTAGESPSAFRPPLYPYLLGGVHFVFGEVEQAGRVLGALFGVLSVWLVYLIAQRFWSTRVALAAAAFAATFPGLVLLSGALVTEPLFQALSLGAVLAVLQARTGGGSLRWAAAAGALCGLAALTRSNGMLLVIAVVLGLLVVRPRLSRAGLAPGAVAVAAALLVVAPWAIRNTLSFDHLVGFNVQTGFGLAGTYNGTAYERDGYRSVWFPAQYTGQYRPLFERADLDEAELDAELRSQAVDWALDHPRYVIETTVLSALRMFELIGEHPAAVDANRAQLALDDTEAAVERIGWYLLALLAVAGFVAIRRMAPERRPPLFVWAVPLLCVAASFPVIGSTRYRTVAYPFLVLAAAPALVAAADRFGGRPREGVAA